MNVDVIGKADRTLAESVKKLGFDHVFCFDGDSIYDIEDKIPFKLKVYTGKDYSFIINKGRADVVADMDKHAFILNKGLCSKLKENKMFVVFKLKSLVETDQFYKVYKNFLINSRLCNDYSVPSLFISSASSIDDMKSPMQLEAFAEHFGYGYKNYKKSVETLVSVK
jgi:hypothetical protein